MILYPAIDLIGGRCVRLQQGDFDRTRTYEVAPQEMALRYAKDGARYIHIVDLDGARARTPKQATLIAEIGRDSGLTVQSGGGIRTVDDARKLIDAGIERVVVGSLAVKQPEIAREIFLSVGGDHFTLAIDVRLDAEGEPFVATEGWTVSEAVSLWTLLESFPDVGLRHVLCTDIGRDGMLNGPNVALYQRILSRYPTLQLQASGGVSSLADLRALRAAGIPGAIIGRALYENRFTLAEALAC